MCCSTEPATFSNTMIYAGEAKRNGQLVHVLAYQNNATNEGSGANAMILPFPTNEKMGQDNIIDTSKFKSFLKNISEATKIQRRLFAKSRSIGVASLDEDDLRAEVFNVGSYTVVLADKVSQVPEALTRVPENKRPKITNRFLIGYGKLYPNQPIAICCFDGTIEAEPLLWWYVPKNQDTLFIPTMDAHDGNAPDVNAMVRTDHIISAGTTFNTRGGVVNYSEKLSDDAKELLPSRVWGTRLENRVKNGDMLILSNRLDEQFPTAKRGELTYEMRGWS